MKQSLKNFLQNNTVTSFEIVQGKCVVNAFVGDEIYGIDSDMSDVQSGTLLFNTTNFSIDLENDILVVDGISVNISQTNMLFPLDVFN
jgi:hypothetical protein